MDDDVEETSSKRRERLLALRSAANASTASAPTPAPAPSLLPDPDLAGDQPVKRASQPHRFDYYTNPAAAFSSSYSGGGGGSGSNPTYSHKRKSPPAFYAPRSAPPPHQPYAVPGNFGNYCPPHYNHMAPLSIHYPSATMCTREQPLGTYAIPYSNARTSTGPGNYGGNYPPPHQRHMAPSPTHSPSPMPQDAPGSSPWRGPMQFQDPMSGYQGNPPGTSPWDPHYGSPGRGSYPNSPSFRFRHPNPGRGGSMMNYRPRGSSYASYGRGRGQNYNNSNPGSWGRGGRGGVGFQNHSGEDRRNYFNKSMVDDPWQDLQPIVGNILIRRGASKSWLPESLREKKELPTQGQIKPSSSGLSLAEYLDLSFNEVSNET